MIIQKKQIFLWGGKSKSRVVIGMIYDIFENDAEITSIFDRNLKNLSFEKECHFSNNFFELSEILRRSNSFVVCIGGDHGYMRYKVASKLIDLGLSPITLVSKHAVLDDVKHCGQGLQAMPGCVVHKFSAVGDFCIINSNATVEHDCCIGNGVHIMPGATLAGNVRVGKYSTIGTNATVLPNLSIGKNAYVGAGAVVTKNVEDNSVVVGNPARFLKFYQPEFSQKTIDQIR